MQNKQHLELECKIFTQANRKFASLMENLQNFNIYEAITVLRCALQKRVNPKNWEKIKSLQSNHGKLKESEIGIKLISGCISFIRDFCQLTDLSDEDISHILGVIAINAFFSDDGVPVDGPRVYRLRCLNWRKLLIF